MTRCRGPPGSTNGKETRAAVAVRGVYQLTVAQRPSGRGAADQAFALCASGNSTHIAAALILVEIGDDMARFGAPQRLACWAALSPGNRESAGKRKSGRIGHGNHAIRHILCECANAARMTKSALAAKYRSLMLRKSHKKAIVALAHKMVRLINVLLTRRQPYLDRAIYYASRSARKNAPRWIRQLKAIGKWPKPPAASRATTAH